ncbi:MAG TPA: D-glycerate dehydrogenase [Bacillaceae bacterium]
MKKKIFISRKLPKIIVEQLSAEFEIDMWEKEDAAIPRDVLVSRIKNADGLYCMITETIDREVIASAPNLKIISNMAVGYNNIDVEAATEKGITVTNTPGVLTETTADLTFALLMATARRLVESSEYLKSGKWETWSPLQLTGVDIYGSTLGIIGMGRIGEAVARRARGFDMKVLYHNRSRKPEAEQALGVQYAGFEEILQKSDFLCLLLPYSREVHHLISYKELNLMKKTAVLINTARGGIVNEEALCKALIAGNIWAAGLDVFEQEPISQANPLLTLPNIVTLPHIGSASIQTRMNMAKLAANNLIHFFNGTGMEKRVN